MIVEITLAKRKKYFKYLKHGLIDAKRENILKY